MMELVLINRLVDKLEKCNGAERPEPDPVLNPFGDAEEHQIAWEVMWDIHDKDFSLKQAEINRLDAEIKYREEYG
jgi:hypothetical protein